MDIERQAAIVTGGASGLGRATAQMLSARGALVTILDIAEDAGQATALSIGGRFIRTDIGSDDSVSSALDQASEAHGPARILVNCAGIAPASRTVSKDLEPHPLDLYRRAIEINLIGTFNVVSKFAARAARAEEIEGERAIIINTASVAAFDGQIGQAAYSASKGGVVSMTLPLARDLAAQRIRVMAIAPGIFLTPMVEAFPQSVQDALGAQVPHPSRLGRPSEFADLVEAIIRNPMLNGETIRIDGAIRMAPR